MRSGVTPAFGSGARVLRMRVLTPVWRRTAWAEWKLPVPSVFMVRAPPGVIGGRTRMGEGGIEGRTGNVGESSKTEEKAKMA